MCWSLSDPCSSLYVPLCGYSRVSAIFGCRKTLTRGLRLHHWVDTFVLN